MRRLAPIAVLLLPFALPAHAQGPVATGVGSQFELTFWQSVESGNDPALYEAYLAQYPNGTFAAVARVKLAKLRQLSAPAPADPAAAPAAVPLAAPVQAVPAPAPQPAPAPIVTAAAPQPAITTQAPPAAPPPAPAAPARKQLASTKAELAATAPLPVPSVRERLAAVPAAPRPTPPASRSAGPRNTDDDDSVPYVTAAPPTEPAAESGDSDALRRLLGALGDSQRMGAPAPAPIVEASESPASDGAPFAAPAAPAPTATPAAAPARLVEVSGPPVAVPDAAALSARAVPAADPRPIAVGPLPAGFALPPRPQLAAIPPLAFPSSFCSADARNAFHDGPYVAAVEAARRNNDAAIAYMNRLQTIYDANQLSGDVNPQNAVAAEARAYGPVAAAAFAAQSTLVSAFSTLMAVPILNCDAPKQP